MPIEDMKLCARAARAYSTAFTFSPTLINPFALSLCKFTEAASLMDPLDEYLIGTFHSDKRDLREIEKYIIDAGQTLVIAFDKDKGMPYTIREYHGKFFKEGISQSTTAMVTLAIYRLLGRCSSPEGLATRGVTDLSYLDHPDKNYKANAEEVADQAAILLLSHLCVNGKYTTHSGTYGDDDPITMAFLVELATAVSTSIETISNLTSFIKRNVEAFVQTLQEGCDKQWLLFRELQKGYNVLSNAIIPLRVVQSYYRIFEGRELASQSFREYFENTLHEQLSFSSIPDSRFDPAELAFCLEGLLLVQRNAVDATLFKRVMDVLAKAQEESAFWRPTRPFIAQDNGMSLFPISVEVANSILRSCEIHDGDELYDTFGSRNIGLFRRYWQWLRARAVRLKPLGNPSEANPTAILGWHSEHVNETNAIHVWETSQVLEFLLLYRKLLVSHIARTTLVRSRFVVRKPKSASKWEETVKTYEPVTILGERYQFYRRIGADFIEGWKQGQPKHFSMLLYGPPGTGKTTVAENIADALGFSMITITVSDFLAGGGAQLEARAKAIFEVLSSQRNCVVLFDEIDNFLLDRDAPRYTKQDTAFQFMTPGMLTKLNNLRREKRLIFIIATNYGYRIDTAIKRTGRIDKQYLALPPDANARKRMIEKFLGEQMSKGVVEKTLKKASLNLGYTDIRGAVKNAMQDKAGWATVLPGILANWARTTSLSTYYSKFADVDDREKPVEEFVALLGLELEVGGDELDLDSVRAIRKALPQFGRDPITSDAVKKKVPDISDDIADKISRILERSREKRSVRKSGVQPSG